eukprot:1335220-Amorphochlora_amoeboformis.AAC.1
MTSLTHYPNGVARRMCPTLLRGHPKGGRVLRGREDAGEKEALRAEKAKQIGKRAREEEMRGGRKKRDIEREVRRGEERRD